MNNVLKIEGRELTEREQNYRIKFLALFQNYDYTLKDNEVFRQMLITDFDRKAYNPSWFVSNYGVILSVARNEIIAIKPTLKTKKYKNQDTVDEVWSKIRKDYYPNWEELREQLKIPHKYYVTNKKSKLTVAKIVALYFLSDGYKAFMQGYAVHHIRPVTWNETCAEMNHADNLQIIPISTHREMHIISKQIVKCKVGLNGLCDWLYNVYGEGLDRYAKAEGQSIEPQKCFHYHLDETCVNVEWMKQELCQSRADTGADTV